MTYRIEKRRLWLFILLLSGGLFLLQTGCSSTRYYNRYPKEKPCKFPDDGARKARKK